MKCPCGKRYKKIDLEEIFTPNYRNQPMPKKCLDCLASLEELTMTIRGHILSTGASLPNS